MEHHARELQSPPEYNNHAYKPLTEEIEFRNAPSHHVQSTVVTIMPEGPPVRDHLIWSFFNAMYLNFCCLGVIALAFSVKSRDRKLIGDKSGATSYGSTARSLNIAATVLAILSVILVIAIVITLQVQVTEILRQNQQEEEWSKMFG
ncbi:dispanin subfamily A member 2b-like [Hyperolius riggenbachi]|uniref:dispanin subfamily A member 2b-like n=1 Tax=Hyperolius riggenbachi TaxID=752182 RepID=UPI0035A3BA7E